MFKVRVPIFLMTLLGASCVVASGQIVPRVKASIEPGPSFARWTTQARVVDTTTRPTDVYKVGVGDVLFVNLKNAQNAAGYYTVRKDGSIDFALASESPNVVGKTVAEIEVALAKAITLYPDPKVEVKVREYRSHTIRVSGMAERVGERSLLREAMPLFAIRAEALVTSNATKVLIRRSEMSEVETYDLRDEKTGDVLIYPGDSVEFTADGQRPVLETSGYLYLSGEVKLPGDMIEISN